MRFRLPSPVKKSIRFGGAFGAVDDKDIVEWKADALSIS